MDLQADIQWIKNELNGVRDPNLIKAFKNLLIYRKAQKKGDPAIDIQQYNRELEVSEKEIEGGNFFTHEEVRKIASQWGRR